jgi:hypothetical protein
MRNSDGIQKKTKQQRSFTKMRGMPVNQPVYRRLTKSPVFAFCGFVMAFWLGVSVTLAGESKVEMWVKRLTHAGVWEVVNQSGEVMAASLSSTDVVSEANAEAAKRGIAMMIVTEDKK